MYHFRVNKILMLAGIAIAAVAVWLLLSRDKTPEASAADPATGSASASGSSASAAPTAKRKPVDKVGRVSRDERARLAELIAKARARRPAGASASGPAPAQGPRPELAGSDVTLVRTTMKEAMREIIPILADCYDKAGEKVPAEIKVVADLTLTGDPDIGTIIDTNGIADGDGEPLEPGFDLCLKDALVEIQMPPLSEGGEVKVTYPLRFSRNGPEAAEGSGNLPP